MRERVRRRLFGYGAVGLSMVACSYDFDEYVEDEAASGGNAAISGGAGGTTAGATAAGEAGANITPGGNTTGGEAARGGAAGAVEAAGEAGASASGAGGEAGSEGGAGSGDGGESSGTGTANGGAASGGASSGGASSGGTPTAGAAGAAGAGGADCDALGGTSFEGHCYFYVSSLLSFEAAQAACADAGATLVAINSAEEQRFLESTFFAPANDAWIGLSLAALTNPNASMCKAMPSACPFRWQTGEPLAYTKWGSHSATDSEPNYTGACVRLQGATLDWADQSCGERVRAICEAE